MLRCGAAVQSFISSSSAVSCCPAWRRGRAAAAVSLHPPPQLPAVTAGYLTLLPAEQWGGGIEVAVLKYGRREGGKKGGRIEIKKEGGKKGRREGGRVEQRERGKKE